jgi:hypothetical protein
VATPLATERKSEDLLNENGDILLTHAFKSPSTPHPSALKRNKIGDKVKFSPREN